MFSVLSPSVGEGQDGLLLWRCQGTAGEVSHRWSPRGTGLGTGLGGWRNQGPGAHGPSYSPFLNLADMTWQVAESCRLQAGQMSGERCGPPWGCLVTQEERLQGVGLAPWPLGPEVRPGLVGSFPLGGARSQASGLSLGVSKHYPLPVPRKVWSKPALPTFTGLKSRTCAAPSLLSPVTFSFSSSSLPFSLSSTFLFFPLSASGDTRPEF